MLDIVSEGRRYQHLEHSAEAARKENRSSVSEAYGLEGESWVRWVHEIRRIEFEGVMKHIPLGRKATALELGCGDGFQLDLLRRRFASVVAIDPKNRPTYADGFAFSIAEALPFPDCAFDLVVSNCVFEHLEYPRRAIEEGVRVLRPGGYMAHVVPSRFWKAASLLLNPFGYPLRVAEKWWARRKVPLNQLRCEECASELAVPPTIRQVAARWLWPLVHGMYSSHRAEYDSYGRERWRQLFTHPRLSLLAEVPLLCCTQFGFLRFRLLSLRRWLGHHGLDGSCAFVLQKVA